MRVMAVKTCLVSIIIKRNRGIFLYSFFSLLIMGLKRIGVPLGRDTFQLERNFRVKNVDSLKNITN